MPVHRGHSLRERHAGGLGAEQRRQFRPDPAFRRDVDPVDPIGGAGLDRRAEAVVLIALEVHGDDRAAVAGELPEAPIDERTFAGPGHAADAHARCGSRWP